jgi:hypothetical protein
LNSYNGFTPDQRMAGLRWLKNEYAEGRRRPPVKCDVCGQTKGILEAHSEDYSEPHGDNIGQFGLCYPCHMMLHCRFRHPRALSVYSRLIEAGKRSEPFFSRNYPMFRDRVLLAMDFPIEEVPPEEATGITVTLADIIAVMPARGYRGKP